MGNFIFCAVQHRPKTCKAPMMEFFFFEKIKRLKLLTVFKKCSILDVLQGSEYAYLDRINNHLLKVKIDITLCVILETQRTYNKINVATALFVSFV